MAAPSGDHPRLAARAQHRDRVLLAWRRRVIFKTLANDELETLGQPRIADKGGTLVLCGGRCARYGTVLIGGAEEQVYCSRRTFEALLRGLVMEHCPNVCAKSGSTH